MKKLLLLAVSVTVIISMTGCCSNRVVAKPGQISLKEAMTSIGEGFAAMKKAEGSNRTGLYPESVTVTFNISAGSSDANGLTVDLNAGAGTASPVSGSVGGSISNSFTAQRANQITVTFKNVLNLNPSNSSVTNAKDLQNMLNVIDAPDNNSNVFLQEKPLSK